jgi:hypothetical protein
MLPILAAGASDVSTTLVTDVCWVRFFTTDLTPSLDVQPRRLGDMRDRTAATPIRIDSAVCTEFSAHINVRDIPNGLMF